MAEQSEQTKRIYGHVAGMTQEQVDATPLGLRGGLELSERLDRLESPARPLAPPADAEQVAGEQVGPTVMHAMFDLADAVVQVFGAWRAELDGTADSLRAEVRLVADRYWRSLADRLAPPATVRQCADCGTRPPGVKGLCDLCQSHQDGYAKRCAEERERASGSEPPLAERLAATMTRDRRLDLAARLGEPVVQPAPAAEPLTAEDGLRERLTEAVDQWWKRGHIQDGITIPRFEFLMSLLIQASRSAPTARATIDADELYKCMEHAQTMSALAPGIYGDSMAHLCQRLRSLWMAATGSRLNPPATAGGSKNKGEVA